MTRVSKEFRFEAAHVLPDYEGPCARLHGHGYRVIISAFGEVQKSGPDLGMVIDFKKLSSIVKERVVDYLDHRILSARYLEPQIQCLLEKFAEDVAYLEIERTTAEQLAQWIFLQLSSPLRLSGVTLEEVQVWETETAHATYGG